MLVKFILKRFRDFFYTKIYYTSFMEKDIELHNVEAGNSFKVQNLSMHEEMG